jgi:hypothetical protein
LLVSFELSKFQSDDKFNIDISKGDSEIPCRLWTYLSDKGVCLLCKGSLARKVSEITQILTKMGELYKRDKRSYASLHDKIIKGNEGDIRSKLSEEFHGRLEKVENEVKLNISLDDDEKSWLIDYLVKAFLILGKLQRLSNEDVKKYCELMLTERRFLEYEVYHALLTLGIPAIPNVTVKIKNENVLVDSQVDVLAAYNGDFWFFEVTTRTNPNDLIEK